MKEKIDIFIKNGILFDGTGAGPFEGDIGISGDRIAFIDKKAPGSRLRSKISAEKTIDARDMTVTPGFIDTHAHSDFTLLADPRAEGKVCQGITTEINGNCGLSAAPLFGDALKQREEDLREYGIKERWASFREYFELLEKRTMTLNFMTLTGHGNLRACAVGYQDRKLTSAEKKEMAVLLRQAIRQGAAGLSTGLIYPPGIYSDTEELIELARYCKNHIYTTHMRSEGDRLLESIAEAIQIGRESGINVHISHIKTSGERNWHKIDGAISMIENAGKEGIHITCDRYPYTASSTDLDTVLPKWVYEGGAEEELRKLKSRKIREKIRRELLDAFPEKGLWEGISLSSVPSRKNKWMEGQSIAHIASRRGSGPVDLLLDILIEERLRIGAIFSSMSEANLQRFLSLPCCMIGTDSSARSSGGPTHKGKPHPRGFGSFPRFLGTYVRNRGLINMSEAVHKITMLPAVTFGIHKRGVLKKGAYADIVVFDHKTINDRATFAEPFLRPEGIHYVVVNGEPALWEGEQTGVRAGKILRHGR
jgi:N-acyl-D-amino-acid deacylase